MMLACSPPQRREKDPPPSRRFWLPRSTELVRGERPCYETSDNFRDRCNDCFKTDGKEVAHFARASPVRAGFRPWNCRSRRGAIADHASASPLECACSSSGPCACSRGSRTGACSRTRACCTGSATLALWRARALSWFPASPLAGSCVLVRIRRCACSRARPGPGGHADVWWCGSRPAAPLRSAGDVRDADGEVSGASPDPDG